jgi:methylmalonyl-CoA mutase
MSQAEPLFSGFPPVDHAAWKSKVLEELKGADYAKIVWKTPEGFSMEPWYNRYTALPFPGVTFSRPTNRWRICQQIQASPAQQASSEAASALDGGADAIEFRLSDPLQGSRDYLAAILRNIDLSKVPVYFSGEMGDASELLDNLMQIKGIDANTGAILKDAADVALSVAASRPSGFRTMAVDTERFHTAGATITQEIAFALAGASDILSRCTDAGVAAVKAAESIETIFCTGTSHFPELAKLRAFRAMWPQLLSAYGVTSASCPEPRIFVRSSQRSASVLDPYTNILRLSTEAVSAILGGCDTLQLSSFDTIGAVSHDFAARITRNIHHLLKDESGLDHVVDPAAGSYYIDTLTETLCREAWTLFQGLEAAGGLKKAEADGMVASMIAPAFEAQNKSVNTRKRSLIGINRYAVAPSAEVAAVLKSAPDVAAEAAPEFERLRLRMLLHAATAGSTPRAALWLHGDPAKCFRVAAFAEDFLRSGGFDITPGTTLAIETKSCRTILQDEPDIIVLCWTGEQDLEALPAILETLQELHKETVVIMASKPPENAADYIKAGLDQFIHLGSDAYATLRSLQHKTGVL